MNTNQDPKDLTIDLLPRSTCAVQVSSVISDRHGIFSWGTNHVGFDGLGQHAEREAIRRANKKRLCGATLHVASTRSRHGKPINSQPCEACQFLINKYNMDAYYRGADGKWHKVRRGDEL